MITGSIDEKGANTGPTFKVAFLGDSSVGKTSIVQRFYQQTFDFSMDNTIGASFVQKDLDTESGPVQLNIWDTAGQERYRSLVATYTRGCHGGIICFSYDSKQSFESLDTWVNELLKQCAKNCIIYICGNKIDLAPEVSDDEVNKWISQKNYKFFKTSAKTGEGVDEMFISLAKDLAETTKITVDSHKNPVPKQSDSKGCC